MKKRQAGGSDPRIVRLLTAVWHKLSESEQVEALMFIWMEAQLSAQAWFGSAEPCALRLTTNLQASRGADAQSETSSCHSPSHLQAARFPGVRK
jgi:hypothetical protein